MKTLDIVVYDMIPFRIAYSPIFWPRDLFMQLIGTIRTTLIGIVPVHICYNTISGFRGEDV